MDTSNVEGEEEFFNPSDLDFKKWAQDCLGSVNKTGAVLKNSDDEGLDESVNKGNSDDDVVEIKSSGDEDWDPLCTDGSKKARRDTKKVKDNSKRNLSTKSKTTRGRRGRRAQQAAVPVQGTVIDSIQLSDTDESGGEVASLKGLDVSAEEGTFDIDHENREVKVKVWWLLEEMHSFQIRKHQKLGPIFDHFSKLANVPPESVVLTVRDINIIKPTDTPASLNLTVADIIEGFAVSEKAQSASATQDSSTEKDELEFKLLMKERKQPLLVKIEKGQNMGMLMIKCAEELGVSVKKLKLIFDGESIEPSATPSDLEMEGGECLDVRIIE